MACVYQRAQLPDDALTIEMAKDHAARLARENKKMVWLVLSRRLSIRIDATGNAEVPINSRYHLLDSVPPTV
jgi:hypothetical protein